MKIVKLLTSPFGRGLRIVLGALVIAIGQFVIGGTPGTLMSVIGIIPIAGGVFDFCIISAILGYGFSSPAACARLLGKYD